MSMSHEDPVAEAAQIAYRVRVSKRARRLQVHITPHCEVEVVLPEGMSHSHVAPFVARHRAWIMRARARQMAALAPAALATGLPAHIHFAALDSHWEVSFHPADRQRLMVRPAATGGCLLLHSASEEGARSLLQRWLSRQAKAYLLPWLAAVAEETGFTYQRAIVRGQRSRWGSCSSRGTISLNRALLFLEPQLVRHLFIHELCHTVHMNHSARFWRLVARHSPRYRALEQALNRAVAQIPRWATVRNREQRGAAISP